MIRDFKCENPFTQSDKISKTDIAKLSNFFCDFLGFRTQCSNFFFEMDLLCYFVAFSDKFLQKSYNKILKFEQYKIHTKLVFQIVTHEIWKNDTKISKHQYVRPY